MKLGIVGAGVVGRATARCFMENSEVRVYDVMKERATHSLEEVLESELVFLCLPTPQKEGSLECDTSAIDDFFKKLNLTSLTAGRGNFVLRSTVSIGTTRRLREHYGVDNLVHSPEFLTARCAVTDAQIPARNIVGGAGFGAREERFDPTHPLVDLYIKRFPGVPIHLMTSDESEAVKLFLNSFFAVKVSYFNEVRELTDKLGLDWDSVLAGVLSDGRIAHAHTQVPGPDGKYGYGGSCLPKDIANLIDCSQKAGLTPHVTTAALHRNHLDRGRK